MKIKEIKKIFMREKSSECRLPAFVVCRKVYIELKLLLIRIINSGHNINK